MSAFVTVVAKYGTFILNALDSGVAASVVQTGSHEEEVITLVCDILTEQHKTFGMINVLDVGANIGINTVAWANHMIGWGTVRAFEPQERVYYALAGNVALNNLENAVAVFGAVSNKAGTMRVPFLNHNQPASFGGLALMPGLTVMGPGQEVSYEDRNMVTVPCYTLDQFENIHLIKIDVEGMEPYVLEGAQKLIEKSKPVIVAEYLHCGPYKIKEKLPESYEQILVGVNGVYIHESQRELIDFVKGLLVKHR